MVRDDYDMLCLVSLLFGWKGNASCRRTVPVCGFVHVEQRDIALASRVIEQELLTA
jgi:hypothetical protein